MLKKFRRNLLVPSNNSPLESSRRGKLLRRLRGDECTPGGGGGGNDFITKYLSLNSYQLTGNVSTSCVLGEVEQGGTVCCW